MWVALALVMVPLLTASYLGHRITSRLDRIDGVFAGLTDRPARPAGSEPGAGAVNILLVVTDHRDDWPRSPRGDAADAALLLHLPRDRRSVVVAALPSAAWTGSRPSAVVATVEQATRLRLDHLAVVDWQEFADLTDVIGGVELEVPQAVSDRLRGSVWRPGLRYFTGPSALDYVQPRPGAPGDELATERRQLTFLSEVLRRTLHQEMARSPRLLHRFLESAAGHSTVDAGWSTLALARLVVSLRNLRSADMHFVIAPASARSSEDFWDLVRTDGIDGATAGRWQALEARTDPNMV